MTDKIFQNFSLHVTFTILDEDWAAIESVSELEFLEDHRRSIESAIDEYIAIRWAMSSAASPKEVKAVLDRINGLASNLFVELMLLNDFCLDERCVNDIDILEVQRRINAYVKKKYKKSDNIPTRFIGGAITDFITSFASKVDESDDVINESRVALYSLINVLEYARRNLPKGSGNPGDMFLNDMLSKVSLVFFQAGGGQGYSSEAMAFWKKLRELIHRYFKEHDKFVPKEAMPALTDNAIKTRLTNINRGKRSD